MSVDMTVTGKFLRVAPSQGSKEVHNLRTGEISLGNDPTRVSSHWPHRHQSTIFLAPSNLLVWKSPESRTNQTQQKSYSGDSTNNPWLLMCKDTLAMVSGERGGLDFH